jgi:hypothetical protein
VGAPARTVWQIIADDVEGSVGSGDEEELVTIHQSPGGRVQVKARLVRDRGRVVEIRFERSSGQVANNANLTTLLNLDEEASRRLIDLCLALRGMDPADGDTLKLDESMLAAVVENPAALATIYETDPTRFKALIEADVTGQDVIAIAARRSAVSQFEELLLDPAKFEAARNGGSREGVWQTFFEDNPWLLGVGLGGHFLTAWDPAKLEKIVAGSSIADVGKRVDAVLSTSGLIRSLVFAELKLHDDPLLEASEYRPGTWAPSRAVVGGVAQALVTAHRARDELGTWLSVRDDNGYRTGEEVFSGAPRSFLVVGTLASLMRDGQIHSDQARSFELFRRSTRQPEVMTYDEVLARAKWSLELVGDTALAEVPPSYGSSATTEAEPSR